MPKNNEYRYRLADFFGMIAIVRWALLLLSPPHILLWWFLAGFLNPAFFLVNWRENALKAGQTT
ncbi:MAG TPA: hypothetical protein DCS31_12595 [Candidatus Competibacteraceae bacterium]|nr:hypothetical protein [Candidatus Competibacteraceae bacterium]